MKKSYNQGNQFAKKENPRDAKPIYIRVNQEEHNKIVGFAQSRGMTLSKIGLMAIMKFIEQESN